jgi:hypothetical protein
VARVAFEERLKGARGMAFEPQGKIAAGLEGAHQAGLAHAARADEGDEGCHLKACEYNEKDRRWFFQTRCVRGKKSTYNQYCTSYPKKGTYMNTKRSLILAASLIFILACSVSMGSEPTPVKPSLPPPQQPVILPTYTPYPTYTVQAPPPASPIPPTAQATPFPLEQTQWNGNFRWFGSLNPVSFIIQKVNGDKFTGAMYWTFDICKVTERTEGDIIYDITTAT